MRQESIFSLLENMCEQRFVRGGGLGSSTCEADSTEDAIMGSKSPRIRKAKSCWSIQTIGTWPWKSESSKDRVITHRSNRPALKMDDATAVCRYRVEYTKEKK